MVMSVFDAQRMFETHRSNLAGMVAKTIYSRVRSDNAIEEALEKTRVVFLLQAHRGELPVGAECRQLYGIAFNVGRDDGRSYWRVRQLEEKVANEAPVPVANPETLYETSETREICWKLLGTLNEVDREIVYRYYADESFAEIAASMGWALEKVRARYYRTMQRLVQEAARVKLAV